MKDPNSVALKYAATPKEFLRRGRPKIKFLLHPRSIDNTTATQWSSVCGMAPFSVLSGWLFGCLLDEIFVNAASLPSCSHDVYRLQTHGKRWLDSGNTSADEGPDFACGRVTRGTSTPRSFRHAAPIVGSLPASYQTCQAGSDARFRCRRSHRIAGGPDRAKGIAALILPQQWPGAGSPIPFVSY